jgi:hypothetical protein
VAASDKGLLASDAIVEELRRVVALRPYHHPEKRPGLREWDVSRLQELSGVTEAQAVSLLDDLGLDWEAQLKQA